MKQKNLPDDIESKSLDELKEILNNLVEKIEKNKASNQSEAVSYTHLTLPTKA